MEFEDFIAWAKEQGYRTDDDVVEATISGKRFVFWSDGQVSVYVSSKNGSVNIHLALNRTPTEMKQLLSALGRGEN